MKYKTSKDYNRLADLIEMGCEVICLNQEHYLDLRTGNSDYARYCVTEDGYGIIEDEREKFIAKCKDFDMEFIEPDDK